MTAKPRLPDDYTLPAYVNGWEHRPSSSMNAHVWYGGIRPAAVGVFDVIGADKAYVQVSDERVDGLEKRVEVARIDEGGESADELSTDEYLRQKAHLTVTAIEEAVEWMQATAPEEWSHPGIDEAIFDAPPGYGYHRAYVEERDVTVYYHRLGAPEHSTLRHPDPEDLTIETCPYLRVHVWRGSGNADVAIAPYLHTHDHQRREVTDCPDECGLDVALLLAREWARENVADDLGNEREGMNASAPATGQAALTAFGGRGEKA